MRHPIVLVTACSQHTGPHLTYAAHQKYVDAVVTGAGCMPLMAPPLGSALDLDALLDVADGIMLTGSPSNVHASLYGQEVRDAALPQDAARDATTLPLIRAALAHGIPLLAICRGFQEINVALGGTLHQAVHEVPGMADHRESKHESLERQYGLAHRVALEPAGTMAHLLAPVLDGACEIGVNSLHGQGIDQLAPGLAVEARAADGLVEAFSVTGAPFALAVQWHPEWRLADNPVSLRLFNAFGDACRAHRDRIP